MFSGLGDAFNASRRLIFGYSDEEKKAIRSTRDYLNTVNKARMELERKVNLREVESSRFAGRYGGTTLQEKANRKANDILNGGGKKTFDYDFNVPSIPGNSIGEKSDFLVLGLLAVVVLVLIK